MVGVSRTNIDIDDELVRRAMQRYSLPTKTAAVNFALDKLVGTRYKQRDMLDMMGSGWDGDLDEMRRTRFPDWSE